MPSCQFCVLTKAGLLVSAEDDAVNLLNLFFHMMALWASFRAARARCRLCIFATAVQWLCMCLCGLDLYVQGAPRALAAPSS